MPIVRLLSHLDPGNQNLSCSSQNRFGWDFRAATAGPTINSVHLLNPTYYRLNLSPLPIFTQLYFHFFIFSSFPLHRPWSDCLKRQCIMNIQWMKHLFNQQAGGFMTQPSQQQEVSQEEGEERRGLMMMMMVINNNMVSLGQS